MRGTWFRSLDREDPLEKEMATHSGTLAWKIPWMEEPSRLQSIGLQRVRHDWGTSLHLTSLQCRENRVQFSLSNSWVTLWTHNCHFGSKKVTGKVQLKELHFEQMWNNYSSSPLQNFKNALNTWATHRSWKASAASQNEPVWPCTWNCLFWEVYL